MSKTNFKSGLRKSITRTGSKGSEHSCKNSDTEALIQTKLRTQEKLLRLAHRTEIKNVKALVSQDASNYVRESMEKLVRIMSKDHRQLAA